MKKCLCVFLNVINILKVVIFEKKGLKVTLKRNKFSYCLNKVKKRLKEKVEKEVEKKSWKSKNEKFWKKKYIYIKNLKNKKTPRKF